MKDELAREYRLRFSPLLEYRSRVWQVLTASFFQQFVPPGAAVLDLGSGWGEFINNIKARKKYAMDLNPDGAERVNPDVQFLNQDCSQRWNLDDDSLDLVFTSNFFEHLRTKDGLSRTLQEAHRCLKRDAPIICMGPNIKYLAGRYWDFWDHYIPLTEQSLAELLGLRGFTVERCWPKFLPYTMVNKTALPLFLVKIYLQLPWMWKVLGKQFLVVARATKDAPVGNSTAKAMNNPDQFSSLDSYTLVTNELNVTPSPGDHMSKRNTVMSLARPEDVR
jgi:ubiquinone/menaquinone biosynthesis C-methylase UbiE